MCKATPTCKPQAKAKSTGTGGTLRAMSGFTRTTPGGPKIGVSKSSGVVHGSPAGSFAITGGIGGMGVASGGTGIRGAMPAEESSSNAGLGNKSKDQLWSDQCFQARSLILESSDLANIFSSEKTFSTSSYACLNTLDTLDSLTTRGLSVVSTILEYLHGNAPVGLDLMLELRRLFKDNGGVTAAASSTVGADGGGKLKTSDTIGGSQGNTNRFVSLVSDHDVEDVCREIGRTIRVKISDTTDVELLRDGLRVLRAYVKNRQAGMEHVAGDVAGDVLRR